MTMSSWHCNASWDCLGIIFLKIASIRTNSLSHNLSMSHKPRQVNITKWVWSTGSSLPGMTKIINGYEFPNWGSHSNIYPSAYMTAAAAIGMTKDEVDTFLKRLDKCLQKCNPSTGMPVVDAELKEKDEKDPKESKLPAPETVVNR